MKIIRNLFVLLLLGILSQLTYGNPLGNRSVGSSRPTNVLEALTLTANAAANTAKRLVDEVPIVASGYFSTSNEYKCSGNSIFNLDPCNMIAHAKFLFGNGQSHWLCACCTCRLGIADQHEAPVLPLVNHGAKVIVTVRDQTFRVMGGSLSWLQELIHSGSLSVSQVDLGDVNVFANKIGKIIGDGIFNTLRVGVNRGSPHLVTERYEWDDRVEGILRDIPQFDTFFKNAEASYGPIRWAWLTLYLGMIFKQHRDKRYRGKPRWRGILNFNERANHMKIMRIIDRKFGRYVDIACEHGTFIVMDLVASGTLDPRITHAVLDALYNGNITLEMGEAYQW